MPMKTGDRGLAIIKEYEGWRSKAYKDAVGVWTIGYGHTSMAGKPIVTPTMEITREEGESILKNDLKKYERAVNQAVKVDLPQESFDALVSFCYNVGPGNFNKSSVLKCVNAKKFDEVPRRLAMWNKAGGRVLRGLVRRRAAEGELFMAGFDNTHEEPATFVDRPRGKPMMKSTTNIAAGLSAAAGMTAATREIVDNTNSIADASPWIVAGIVVLAATAWVFWERYKKSRDEAI